MIGILIFVFASSSADPFNVSRHSLGSLARELSCELPPFPKNGAYALTTEPAFSSIIDPGRIYIRVVCDPDYSYSGALDVYCANGTWSDEIARCIKYCPFDFSFGIKIYCTEKRIDHPQHCFKTEDGDTVYPSCAPPYYHKEDLPPVHCRGRTWTYKPECKPVCGLQQQLKVPINQNGVSLGWVATESELPWHVGIYNKLYEPYMQTCGGSVVGRNIVVSAAHCFWSDVERLQPASRFAVAGGKLYRPWNLVYDYNAQKSDVDEIVIPPRFWGAQTNFQDDIALVFLKTRFEFNTYVWPICIDFDTNFDNAHLEVGRYGISGGWGLTSENGEPSQTLQVLSLPYVDIYKCIADAQPDYRVYITSDKFCAGHTNGSAACRGDSGGGLAFFEPDNQDNSTGFYYLRGVISTAPKSENICNTFAITSLTRLSKHEELFQKYYHKMIW